MKSLVRWGWVAAALLLAYWIGLQQGSSRDDAATSAVDIEAQAGPTQTHGSDWASIRMPSAGLRSVRSPAARPGTESRAETESSGDVPSSSGHEEDSGPFLEPDRAWMRVHGFPIDDEEVSRYSSMSDAELARRADEDKLAAYEQCYRQLYRDRLAEVALDCLAELAARGSHYAMQSLAFAYLGMGAEGVVVDRLLSQAWLRASYRLGNWSALLPAHNLNADQPMSPDELLLADALAAQIIDDLDRRHRARTGEPLPITPMPGFENTIEHYLEHGLDEPDTPPDDP